MTKLSNLIPGTIVEHRDQAKHYVIVSSHVAVRSGNLLQAVPVVSSINKLNCSESPHLIIPTNLKIRGIICPHQLLQFESSELTKLDTINQNLATYLVNLACKNQ